MPSDIFHPLIQQWFDGRFREPTEPQRLGWPLIAAGRHTLIAAPTGSGKTLAAFLVSLDQLLRQSCAGGLSDRTQVLYVSPLKALSNDIQRNLAVPLAEIRQLADERGYGVIGIRAAVRTGDTPASERQSMLRRPPHILVTTPESLYLLLTSPGGRELLRSVRSVIVDEIHALARDKRGSHLALSLERLQALCDHRLTRVGLSATQRPILDIARFLVGASNVNSDSQPDCEVIDCGHVRELDIGIETPPSALSAVCSHEQWDEIYQRLTELIQSHRSTLVFVNTRRLAERVAHHLTEILGADAVASHHGSLSRPLRLAAEQRLKNGQLRAIVATASLEMGIDIGYIDLVCQVGSPRSIATLLQRVGRSGHSLGKIPCGRLLPLTRDELLECMALVRAVRRQELDQIEIPECPLDILAQQIVAAVACEEWNEQALFELCRRAWPFRRLERDEFDAIVRMLSDGLAPAVRRGAYVHRDQIAGRLRGRKGARLAALTSGGAIPETAEYRVVTEQEKTLVGTVDEDFAIESLAGDVFLLGNTSWRISYVRGGEVVVRDAAGAPPSIPFWFGEAPGRTRELSLELSRLRREIADRIAAASENGGESGRNAADERRDATVQWLSAVSGAARDACRQAVEYVASQLNSIGLVPTVEEIVFERFFDESGGMQLVIHSPLGARVNRAWGLALRKRFCRRFDFELQAAATDNGIVLSLSPQHSFPIDSLFGMVRTDNARALLEQALLAVPMFQVRWRWNVTRSLVVLRQQGGKKVPAYLQRFRADDALAAVFPQTVGCLENHQGDIPIPDHPLVKQTMHDCLHEAMDADGWQRLLADVAEGRVRLIARETREASPFCHELLNANPYAFLDPAPLEERRTRAVMQRRLISEPSDLAELDPDAIRQVTAEAWPVVRSADELHDALLSLVVLSPAAAPEWADWFGELVAAGRATEVRLNDEGGGCSWWIAAERWPLVRAVYPAAVPQPALDLPGSLDRVVEQAEAGVELLRGQMACAGPVTIEELSTRLELPAEYLAAALESLEGQGVVLRGEFRRPVTNGRDDARPLQWCDRLLLARIHRLTLDGLRQRIQPVEPEVFLRFLLRHHGLTGSRRRWGGPVALREILAQLQGFELPAGAWEAQVLEPRMDGYDPQWLDQLFLAGEVVWGRLRSPPREDRRRPSMATLTRTVPMSLMLRGDLPWLLPQPGSRLARLEADTQSSINSTNEETAPLRANARVVLETLRAQGALFFQELVTKTGLLPAHLEEALRELAAAGLVTSDAFAAIRALVGRGRQSTRQRRGQLWADRTSPAGRWSRFPGEQSPPDRQQYLQLWCRLLLARYGIVFRDVLVRESVAPPWQELVPVFRRLELRGEVRGGRFISGVSGQQFASELAVQQLREIRDEPPSDDWVVISAADPVNLVGIVSAEPRIAATHKNSLVLQNGRCVAAKQAGLVQVFLDNAPPAVQHQMRRALILPINATRSQEQFAGEGASGRLAFPAPSPPDRRRF